jgi:hypothetical protein
MRPEPAKGIRFLHARVLNPRYMPKAIPQEYEITQIRGGLIYCRAVHRWPDRIELGAVDRYYREDWDRICGSVVLEDVPQ